MLKQKKEKFVRIAKARTNKIISMVQLLGNCASPSCYEYTEKDVFDIFNTIKREVKISKMKFNSSEENATKFKLSR